MPEDYQFSDEPEDESAPQTNDKSSKFGSLKLNHTAPGQRPSTAQSELGPSERYDTVTGSEDWQRTKFEHPVHQPKGTSTKSLSGPVRTAGVKLEPLPEYRPGTGASETFSDTSGYNYDDEEAMLSNNYKDTRLNDEMNDSGNAEDAEEREQIVMSPRLQELMMLIEAKEKANWNVRKASNSNYAREKAIEEAYVRCLNEREQAAAYNDLQSELSNNMLDAWKRRDQLKQETVRVNRKMLKQTLDQQASESHTRNAKDREARRNAKMAFFLPDNAGQFTLPLEGGQGALTLSMRREKFCQDLASQIQKKAEVKAKTKYEQMMEERDYLDHIAVELDMQNAVERTQHLEKQQSLLEAWERDAHIRNLKELEGSGTSVIQTYINNNLPDVSQLRKKTTGFGSMSVGYDPRTSRR
jgi:hypothetical protein